MASATYTFRSWSASGGAGNAVGYVVVNWNYDNNAKRITITGVSYGGSNNQWYVGSSMKMGIRWSDGQETILAQGVYNFAAGNYIIARPNAGFTTISGVLGVFSDANNHCPASHTFSGSSGGFTVWFGSTSGTINAGNPQSYRELNRQQGDNPSYNFSRPPAGASITVGGSTCNSITVTSRVADAGQGSALQQRIEWSSNNFATYGTSPYSSSTSYTYTVTGLEPMTTYQFRSYVRNASGGVNSGTVTGTTLGSLPTLGNPTASNPDVYRAIFSMPSVNWGQCGDSFSLTLNWTYTADGITQNFSKTWGGVSNASYDTLQDSPTPERYYTEVPDDDTISYTWTARKRLGSRYVSAVKTGTLYCQPSYEAYVIEKKVNNGQPVRADMIVSNAAGQVPTKTIRRIDVVLPKPND